MSVGGGAFDTQASGGVAVLSSVERTTPMMEFNKAGGGPNGARSGGRSIGKFKQAPNVRQQYPPTNS